MIAIAGRRGNHYSDTAMRAELSSSKKAFPAKVLSICWSVRANTVSDTASSYNTKCGTANNESVVSNCTLIATNLSDA